MLNIDLTIVISYLLITLALGIYTGRNLKSLSDFAVSHRNFSTPVMVATLCATVIGGGSTYGVAEKAFSIGILYILVFYGAAINKLLVAQFVAPKIGQFQKMLSVGDVMNSFYGRTGRIFSGIAVCLVSVGSVSSQVSAIGYTLESLLNVPFFWGAIIGFGVLVIYSAFGGMRSVVSTDVLQFIIMIVCIPIVCSVGLSAIGGFSKLLSLVPQQNISISHEPAVVCKAIDMFLVLTFSALDPSFIQRLLISKDIKQAIRTTRITGIISFPFFTIMGLIGLISLCLKPDLQANFALPYLIQNVLPIGLKGLAVAGLLAAVMSTADSDLNVVGISLVQDLIIPMRKKPISERSQLRIARFLTLICGTGSIFIALNFKSIIDIMVYAFSFWGPTILVPFLFGLYGIKTTTKQFVINVSLASFTVLFWNIVLNKPFHFDGLIPGMVVNTLAFTYSYLTSKRLSH